MPTPLIWFSLAVRLAQPMPTRQPPETATTAPRRPTVKAAHRSCPSPVDTSAAIDTPPFLWTTALLTRIQQLMAQVQQGSVSLHTFAADSANYAHVAGVAGPFEGVDMGVGTGPTQRAVFDLGMVAAKVPAVADAFRRAHLTPAQYLPLASALLAAEFTDSLEIFLEGLLDTPVGPADEANVIWQNVAFLRAHRPAIDALGMPLPALGLQFNGGEVTHFLDTTALARHGVRFQTLTDPGTNFQNSFLDSTDAPGGAAGASGRPLRVLFIGNSLTYFHAMPRIFSALSAHGLHRRVVVGLASLPGASPLMLWATTDARQVIAALPWDAVVVQLRPNESNTAKTFRRYARVFTHAITARHAKAVLWTQFGDLDTPSGAQDLLNATLGAAATAAGASVGPIPAAWAAVQRADTATWRELYDSGGGGHPSALGSYLIALVLYRTITGQSPVGLPPTAGGMAVPERTAALLQQIAAQP